MHPKLVRGILYPLQERLMRRPTFRLLDELETSQWHSKRAMRDLQAAKLTLLLRHLAEKVPHFTEILDLQNIDPSEAGPFDVLERLPTTDKRSLREQIARSAPVPTVAGTRPMSTGGSTGEPLQFWVDPARSAYDKAARMRAHLWFGIEPGDREAYLWAAAIGNRRQDRARAIRDIFLNDLLLSAFDLSPQTVRTYAAKLNRFKPSCIFGYPSSLATFCRIAQDEKINVRLPGLRAVFTTGEVLDPQQRRLLRDFFNVPVADGYGGRDTGSCAHECPAGSTHITSEHVILEIVDAQGRPVRNGTTGEIVVTNLDNFATPFVRYRTGDMGRLSGEACPCGRNLSVLDVVDGRRTDHLVAADGSLRHALSVIYLMRERCEIQQFQIRQQKDRSLDVQVVTGGGISRDTREHVLGGLRKCLGDSLTTRLQIVDRIAQQPSGKFRHVISEATESAGQPQ